MIDGVEYEVLRGFSFGNRSASSGRYLVHCRWGIRGSRDRVVVMGGVVLQHFFVSESWGRSRAIFRPTTRSRGSPSNPQSYWKRITMGEDGNTPGGYVSCYAQIHEAGRSVRRRMRILCLRLSLDGMMLGFHETQYQHPMDVHPGDLSTLGVEIRIQAVFGQS